MGFSAVLFRVSCGIIALTLLGSSVCKKYDQNCARTRFGFELAIKAYPNVETIHVFDTLYFEIDAPTTLKDLRSGNDIDYSRAANLGTALSFAKLDTAVATWTTVDFNDFLVFPISGLGNQIDQNQFAINFLFSENSGRYRFLLAVLPRKPGTFSILFSNSGNTYRHTDVCTKANFHIVFRNTDQHYYLHPGFVPGSNLTGGDYYFVVR